MPKHAISITLERDNLLWLRAQTAAAKGKSLSDTLDRLIAEARHAGQVDRAAIRSVVGTIDISGEDPGLETSDAYLRGLFERSARRPFLVKDTPPASSPRRKRRG